jgi:hypothetical protein
MHAPIGRTLRTFLYLCTCAPEHSGECAGGHYAARRRRGAGSIRAKRYRRGLPYVGAGGGRERAARRFFVRVIWQESRFNALAVSPKGAQGIAQFMPRTADWRGLGNPFDVIAALKTSASYLRDLRDRFGNLGLAAAAYNAGPQRVQDWLLARSGLPKETRRYVQIVTGHRAEEWSAGPAQVSLALPEPVPCRDVAKSMKYPAVPKADNGPEKALRSGSAQNKPAWGVQLVGSPSQASALASFQQLQRSYKSLLEARHPLVIQSRVGTNGFWYRVRVATETRTEADNLCSGLRAAGASCLVQRN